MSKENILIFLNTIGFKLKTGTEGVFCKKYTNHNNYLISIELNKKDIRESKINYGDLIKTGRGTTSNFSQNENFVVLECVNRLLEKGYSPEGIFLEKDWKLGHRGKGNLDIQVLDKKGESFLMIECKTFGNEFQNEEKKIYQEGGQLFSYYIQENSTQYLCLYTSKFNKGEIEYKNNIIKITEKIRNAKSQIDAYEEWKPQIIEQRGIFEYDSNPYDIKFIKIKKKDLKPLTKEDGGDIFNRFAEILRRNVISDKSNAYNKIFNLFLCKIVDETETEDNKDLKFQWSENETNEDVLLRLNTLYKNGMKHYLNLEISAIDIEEFDKRINNIHSEDDKQKIKDLFIKQKLYSSNDLAFREVFDENTFNANCEVVKEVVKLLESFKIKYETKQQFLGDFFERLLNTGIKQESGQFFTPVPIAQFICKSLPLESIITQKIKNGEYNILPYIIDYASGAGHFITEGMEEVASIIKNLDEKNFKNQKAKSEFLKIKNNFDFADEYVYGIEKDYRLAKTTKVATYLNGDGDARIICGDGLDSFFHSKDYSGALKNKEEHQKDNLDFDVVVANPPYSVSGFKTTLNRGADSFEFYDNFTDKSQEIECLFLERTKQLLNDTYGVCGLILPISILDGGKIYTLTRDLILENFEIKGIVQLGTKTFMETGTHTIALFLKKTENISDIVSSNIKKSITEKKDNSINSVEKPIEKFLNQTYKISFEKYLRFFENTNFEDEELNEIEIYKEYVKWAKKTKKKEGEVFEYIKHMEFDKLKTFILTYGKRTIISTISEDNEEQREFLGFKFSKARGSEGIHISSLGGKLYNPDDINDKSKVNYYILQNFLNKPIEEIHEEAETIQVSDLNECIDFNTINFEKVINLDKDYKINFYSKHPTKKLGELISENKKSDIQVSQATNKKQDKYVYFTSGENTLLHKNFLLEGENLFLSTGGNAYINYYNGKASYSTDTWSITSKDESIIKTKTLFYLLRSKTRDINKFYFTGKGLKHLKKLKLREIEMPLLPEIMQDEMVRNIKNIEEEEIKIKKENAKILEKIQQLLDLNYPKEKLSNFCKEIRRGASPRPIREYLTNKGNGVNWIKIGDTKNVYKYIESSKEFITIEGAKKSKKVGIGDLIMSNSMTVGKPFLIKKEGYIHDGWLLIKPDEKKVDSEFLFYLLNSKETLKNLAQVAKGKVVKNLNIARVENLELSLPNLQKQREILKEIQKIEPRFIKNKERLEIISEEILKVVDGVLN